VIAAILKGGASDGIGRELMTRNKNNDRYHQSADHKEAADFQKSIYRDFVHRL
jgi:hypothetical protein